MRKYLLILCALCLVGAAPVARAGSFDAQGQFVGTVSPVITALLAEFPAGGPGLRAGIALAVQADPALAADAVFAAQGSNSSQKEAVGSGLADAANFFGKMGTAAAVQAKDQIQAALTYADAGTQAGANAVNIQAAQGSTSTQGIPGFTNTTTTIGGCVSQATATGC